MNIEDETAPVAVRAKTAIDRAMEAIHNAERRMGETANEMTPMDLAMVQLGNLISDQKWVDGGVRVVLRDLRDKLDGRINDMTTQELHDASTGLHVARVILSRLRKWTYRDADVLLSLEKRLRPHAGVGVCGCTIEWAVSGQLVQDPSALRDIKRTVDRLLKFENEVADLEREKDEIKKRSAEARKVKRRAKNKQIQEQRLQKVLARWPSNVPAQAEAALPPSDNAPVRSLGLSVRTMNGLLVAGYKTLGDIKTITDAQLVWTSRKLDHDQDVPTDWRGTEIPLASLNNFGRKSLRELIIFLHAVRGAAESQPQIEGAWTA